MAKIKWLTAGESHGKGIVGIIEGIPANLEIDKYLLQHELRRRQKGYGRGGRMQIESDAVEIISGIRFGKTIGSPITVFIENKDWQNWHDVMAVFAATGAFLSCFRGGAGLSQPDTLTLKTGARQRTTARRGNGPQRNRAPLDPRYF